MEQLAAEMLLDAGISIPLFRIKVPFCRPWVVRITMRRPFWGTQMRIARIYRRSGIDARKLATLAPDEEMRFFDDHLGAFTRMLALTVCRGYISGIVLAPLVAWLMRWKAPREYLIEAQRRFRKLRPSRDFLPITAWADTVNPFKPETGREKIRSGR